MASREQLDSTILDAAGGLFARHGFRQTSVQAVADAVGFSKAGLLHHFPSKQALYDATLSLCATETDRLRQKVRSTPPGRVRDLSAIRLLVDLALARQGLVAFLLATLVPSKGGEDSQFETIGASLMRMFDDGVPDVSRTIRVGGALAALGVLTLSACRADEASAWRNDIVNTCFDALGHPK